MKRVAYILFLSCLFGVTTATAQEMTREERIKALERLQAEDIEWEKNTLNVMSQSVPEEIETMSLPPLSVFLDAVEENATVKRAQSQIDQAKNELSLQKRDWWNLIRISAGYSYGKYNTVGNASDELTPIYQTVMSSAQHSYNIGAGVAIPLGEFTNRKKKLKQFKYNIEQDVCIELEYTLPIPLANICVANTINGIFILGGDNNKLDIIIRQNGEEFEFLM